MDPKLKICGMRDSQNILKIAEAGPDLIGFIFYKESPRYVGEDFEIPEQLPGSINRVGVFVNETKAKIMNMAALHGLTHVQLHGHESVTLCQSLIDAGLKVIKVFSVGNEFDFSITIPYKNAVDYLMFDTKGIFYGGNAKPFDWRILDCYDQEIPFFLSGGISPENIQSMSALKNMNLYAIDVNSGVEAAAGVKDINKVNDLISKLKATEF